MAPTTARRCAHCHLVFQADVEDFPLLEPFIALHERYCAGDERAGERWTPYGALYASRRRGVLVCCPHDDEREALRLFLEALGHVAFDAPDLAGADAAVAAHAPNIIVVDLSLTGGDVAAFATRIRGLSPRPLLVALSGRGGASEREQARQLGFDVYLLKPVDPEELEPLVTLPWLGAG